MASNTSYVDLLIVGAGPAGLMGACRATQYNMSTRIIDQKAGRTQAGHADGLHSRTLEILDSFRIGDPILKQGASGVDECYWVTFLYNIQLIVLYLTEPRLLVRRKKLLNSARAMNQVLRNVKIWENAA